MRKPKRERDKKLDQFLSHFQSLSDRETRSPAEQCNHIVQSLSARGVTLSEDQRDKLLALLEEKKDKK